MQVIVGRTMQVSARSLVHIANLTLAVGGTYGIGVVARNSIGESSTYVGAFTVPGMYPHSVYYSCERDGLQ